MWVGTTKPGGSGWIWKMKMTRVPGGRSDANIGCGYIIIQCLPCGKKRKKKKKKKKKKFTSCVCVRVCVFSPSGFLEKSEQGNIYIYIYTLYTASTQSTAHRESDTYCAWFTRFDHFGVDSTVG